MTRRSLRDRNIAAIAHDIDDAPEEPGSPTELAQQEAAAPAAPRAARPAVPLKRLAPEAAGASDRLGIYLTPVEFDGARGAYLADWMNGGAADTFGRWIAGALDAHADRTPKQRADRGGLRGRAGERTGSTRSFSVPTATMQRLRAAITADQKAGRWPSDSAWSAEAIAIAVDEARRANGGRLPTPPARLPNRLAR
jgi:hypothetical protein